METTQRKGLGKKIRFEVFKRDSFTCQYCGRKAPDVILHVDHIKPVATGGTNDLMNLITSCFDCNSGKSKNELSDTSVIEKQRRQLEDLEERRQQLDLLMEWHIGLQNIEDDGAYKILEYWNLKNSCAALPTEVTKKEIKRLIKKFGFKAVLEAVDIVAEKYVSLDVDARFKKLGSVLTYMNASDDDKKIMYVKGVCKNRFNYFDIAQGSTLIKKAVLENKAESALNIAKNAVNWTDWKSQMQALFVDTPAD